MANVAHIGLNGTILDICDLVAREIANSANTESIKNAARLDKSVTDYGADPTGVNDSTANIQAAVDAAHDNKINVYFPAGTYKITAPIKYYSDMTIYGDGATLIWDGESGTVNAMMWISSDQTSGGYAGCHHVQFRQLHFDGNNLIVTLICFAHGQHCGAVDCEFKNISNWHFIEFNSSQWAYAVRCDFHNHSLKAATGEMIQFDAATSISNAPNCLPLDGTVTDYVIISNCTFHNEENFVQGDATGVAAFGSHNNVNNCSHIMITDCFIAQMFAGARFLRITALQISNSYFQNVKCAMVFNNGTTWSTGEVVRYAVITGNVIAGYADGIAIDFYPTGGSFGSTTSEYCTITDNQISNVSAGIRVLNNTTLISNNNIFGTSGITVSGGSYVGPGNAINGVWQS